MENFYNKKINNKNLDLKIFNVISLIKVFNLKKLSYLNMTEVQQILSLVQIHEDPCDLFELLDPIGKF